MLEEVQPTPKVFIVNASGHDYSAAESFGDLVVMSFGRVDKFHCTEMVRTFQSYIASSSPDDFILQSGPSVMNAIACAMFASRHEGRLNLLLWRIGEDGIDSYVPRRMNLQGDIR